MTGSEVSPSFRLVYVPGVIPGKWVRIWQERLPDVPLTLVPVPAADAHATLRAREAEAGFVRLPVDGDDLHAIPLYTETTVVVVPKDHLLTAADEVTTADLAEETVLHPLDDTLGWETLPGEEAFTRPATTADAIELVAAGIGLLAVPQSLARLHHRRDLTYRPLTDAPVSRVGLSWPKDEPSDLVEDMIGIVRGRTVNSTRGRPTARATEDGPATGRRKDGGKGQEGTAKKTGTAGRGRGAAKGRPARSGGAKSTRRGAPRRRS
ncbi:LysR family transcriptional regulator substrate-binding protein [Streptomyces catenulae]|uniref:LysR family transcriptional regulator substrate-binding protein n=1 Tax=Streptomyces catenulae TaxID=66875 RepID=A0ABV2YSK3_9ACTN|nr:LysR family transcriptional regulator substrate-binding protein [Streptomyces catenulae]